MQIREWLGYVMGMEWTKESSTYIDQLIIQKDCSML